MPRSRKKSCLRTIAALLAAVKVLKAALIRANCASTAERTSSVREEETFGGYVHCVPQTSGTGQLFVLFARATNLWRRLINYGNCYSTMSNSESFLCWQNSFSSGGRRRALVPWSYITDPSQTTGSSRWWMVVESWQSL